MEFERHLESPHSTTYIESVLLWIRIYDMTYPSAISIPVTILPIQAKSTGNESNFRALY